ncbi:tetratricopeptide repeat protein [Nitrincola alkalilacustris]|uniref:tetratricopeptide repeat protein n=1 Tax=Nitrincola alkalilacustris TaxID=1571224 RepID=UPI00124C48D2|nr:tetratricopeptide repeat protein [Nitrincola alkalilacustris]
MAPRRISYADKRVLLIESSGNMRATIVHMLRELGIQNIQAMTVNERVLDLVQEEHFDIILLGHNSSDKVTGIQLLEEARYRGYMRPTSGWIFMTSDSSQQVVLHAIDSNPDSLITKPFSIEDLKHRIDALVAKKQALKPADQALEAGDLERAVLHCDDIPPSDPCYDFAQRLKSELLLQLGRPDEAYEALEKRFWQTSDKDTGLVLAKALLKLDRLADGREVLMGLVESYPLFVPALDLLAKVHELNGDLAMAREVLQEATSKSPLGIPRQMELGRVATQVKALKLAEGAYRRSITLGRSSCYRSPEPYLKLANIRRLEMKDADKKARILLHNELDELLNHAEFSFPKDQEFKVRSALLRAQACQENGEINEAERLLKLASQHNHQLSQPLDLKREVVLLSGDDVPILEPVKAPEDKKKGKTKVVRDEAMSDKVNLLGVRHYMAGKLNQALRYFNLAMEYNPANGVAMINLAQLYLEAARDSEAKRDERIKMVGRFLLLADRVPLSPAAKVRQAQLKKLIKLPVSELPAGSLGSLLR